MLVNYKKKFSINHIAYFSYLKYGAVPEDISFDSEIKTIPVGHYAKFDFKGSIEYNNYFQLKHFEGVLSKEDESDKLEEIKINIKSIIKSIAVKNKKIHILISGGIDSTLAAFYLRNYSDNIVGHFCQFGDYDPELKYAQKVADKIDVHLEVHKIDSDMVVDCIKNTALNTTYPHGDYSNVALNYLLVKIYKKYGKEAVIIECNGADDGFGYGGLNQIKIWNRLFKYPTLFFNLIFRAVNISNFWINGSDLSKKILGIVRAKDKMIYSSHTMLSAGEMVYSLSPKKMNTKANDYLKKNIDDIIDTDAPSLYEQMNTIQFFHINSRLWVAKGYTPAETLGLDIKYPFTWKKILNLQSTLSREMKIKNGIVKWSLKKALEDFMDHEFIYRAKSGFAPPLVKWLDNSKISSYFSNTIFNGQTIGYLNRKKIRKIFIKLKKKDKVSRYATTLLWSILFFEEWLIQHKIKIAE